MELARECIRKTGIGHLENRSVTGLSGGEWQRMIIARALCQESSILLLDEPVASLDIKHQGGHPFAGALACTQQGDAVRMRAARFKPCESLLRPGRTDEKGRVIEYGPTGIS